MAVYMTTLSQALESLIANAPGRTERELSGAIFGDEGYQPRVNQDCNLLCSSGKVERRGDGGPSDPYRYYPAKTDA